MAPSAESAPNLEYATNEGGAIPKPRAVEQRKTVAFAVNYEPSMVGRFWHTKSVQPATPGVKPLPPSTARDMEARINSVSSIPTQQFVSTPSNTIPTSIYQQQQNSISASTPATSAISSSHMRNGSNLENDAPNVVVNNSVNVGSAGNSEAGEGKVDFPTKLLPTMAEPPIKRSTRTRRVSIKAKATPDSFSNGDDQQEPQQMRRSNREKKKSDVPVVSTRVRYDMEMVPYVNRNREFLKSFPPWPLMIKQSIPRSLPDPPLPRRSSRLTKDEDAIVVVPPPEEEPMASCESCQTKRPELPFESNSSVIWIPEKRSHWEHSVSEMTAVCTSAALRRHTGEKPFQPPLSRDYIRDRIDIDDPLNGYQIRHRTGGWLQGFVLWTNFTTWTHFFKWDSLNEIAGVKAASLINDAVDRDGSLALQLDQEPRSGDPTDTGIVFETIAEIALLGGLGCGEYLLRMALESILRHKRYKFVVLQATEGSRTFYERFGFRRVGAVCRYGKRGKNGITEYPTEDHPLQGYRHWTHFNESEKSLDLHGGPSYMMCLELPSEEELAIDCETCASRPSFLDEMLKLKVDEKPTVEPIGASATPAPKKRTKGRNSLSGAPKLPPLSPKPNMMKPSPVPAGSITTTPAKKALPAPAMSNLAPPSVSPFSTAASVTIPSAAMNVDDNLESQSASAADTAHHTAQTRPRPKRSHSSIENQEEDGDSDVPRAIKLLKIEGIPPVAMKRDDSPTERDSLLAPPPEGSELSYAQKQYHSVWLAVPPKERQTARKAPRERTQFGPPDLVTGATLQPTTPAPTTVEKRPAATTTATTTEKKRKPSTTVKATSVSTKTPRVPEKPQQPKRPPATSKTSTSKEKNRKSVNQLDKSALMKQKMKSYPRDRVHFYNKVVQKKNSKGKVRYYFVLNYNEPKGTLKLVPMEPRGVLSGKREGRPRFQCIIDSTDHNFINVAAADYEAVPAFMVMKTPVVAQEAWDIMGA